MRKWSIAAAAVAVLAVIAYFALGRVADSEAKTRVEQLAGQMRKHVNGLEYGQVTTAPLNRTVEVHDVRFDLGDGASVVISTLAVSGFDLVHRDMPRYASLKAKGVVYKAGAGREEWLPENGMLLGEAEFRYSLDDRTGDLDLHFYGSATGAGTVSYDLKLGGVEPGMVDVLKKGMDDNPLGALSLIQVTLVNATLKYTDDALVGRALQSEARQRAVSVEDVRAEAVKTLTAIRDSANDKGVREANEAMIAFVNSPRSITVTAAPPRPVPLVTLLLSTAALDWQNPKRMYSMEKQLGIRVRAE